MYPKPNQSREERLNELLTDFLLGAKDTIDADRKRDYEEEVSLGKRPKVPDGIVNIAYRLAANMVIRAVWNQNAQGVKNDDFDVSKLSSEVFTPDIASDLALFPAKINFRIRRLRTKREIEASKLV